nr:MAG TPA: hypothetical protein [Caudoviricetes sp.]
MSGFADTVTQVTPFSDIPLYSNLIIFKFCVYKKIL